MLGKGVTAFQISNICITALQSFLAPLIFGVAVYGQQMLVLAPAFFLQALLEPHLQFHFNDGAREGAWISVPHILVLTTLAAAAAAVFVGVLGASRDLGVLALVGAVTATYVLFTALQAHAFAQQRVDVAARSLFAAGAVYAVAITAAGLLQIDNPLLLSTAAAFGAGVLAAAPFSVPFATFERPSRVHSYGTIIASVCQRLPTTAFSSGTIIALGSLGASAALVGQFKIFTSIVNASRFLNLVPLPLLQLHLSKTVHDAVAARENAVVRRYILFASFSIVACGIAGPIAYKVLYGTPAFGWLSLMSCSFVVLVQPLSYFFMVVASEKGLKTAYNTGTHLLVAFFMVGIFSWTFLIWRNPFLAAAASTAVSFGIYGLAFQLLGWRWTKDQ